MEHLWIAPDHAAQPTPMPAKAVVPAVTGANDEGKSIEPGTSGNSGVADQIGPNKDSGKSVGVELGSMKSEAGDADRASNPPKPQTTGNPKNNRGSEEGLIPATPSSPKR